MPKRLTRADKAYGGDGWKKNETVEFIRNNDNKSLSEDEARSIICAICGKE